MARPFPETNLRKTELSAPRAEPPARPLVPGVRVGAALLADLSVPWVIRVVSLLGPAMGINMAHREAVRAIQDKPKAKVSSISRKDTEMKAAKSIVLRGAKEQLFLLALAAVSLFGVGSAIAF